MVYFFVTIMISFIYRPFRKLVFFALLLCCLPATLMSQTVSGTIVDDQTGETLIGATVMDMISGKGTVTNNHGRFSLTLKQDSVYIRISYVGYDNYFVPLRMDRDYTVDVALVPTINLEAVVITAERPTDPNSSQMSAIAMPVEHLKAVPVLFGESDVLKALQLLPGVQSGSEGMNGMYVRGGGPDQNLFLMDGVPLYNVNHLGGFFSAFNADAIKGVTLYKGSFPARFGGRLSSVLDITTNNGNDREYHGNLSVGMISAKFNIEGPIVKEKTTFSLSARRTYGDVFLMPIMSAMSFQMGGKVKAGYYFYDLNAKVTHKFSDRSRLYASYYMGDDAIYANIDVRNDWYDNLGQLYGYKETMKMGYNWGNIVSSLRWNYVINPKLFMNVTGSYTQYRNDVGLGMIYTEKTSEFQYEEEIDMSYKSGIRDISAYADFDYNPNPDHNVRFGGGMTHHVFTPEVMGMRYDASSNGIGEDYDESIDTVLGQSIVHANELNFYAEDDWSVTEVLKMNYGVRLSGFGVQGKYYPSVQPRLSGRWLLSDDLSAKVGYAYMTQYMHLLSNSNISLPTDLWVPVTASIKPMNAHQVAAGLAYSFKSVVDFSLEGYYKHMNNLMEYKDGASFWSNSVGWEDKVCLGKGWSYGLEFLVQKSVGDFSGWIGYTWSRTMRLFDRPGQEVSGGKPFPAKYDRRHDLSVVVMYKPSDKFDFSVNWVYCTGNTATLGLHEYEEHDVDGWTGSVTYVESRNNFRMPDYHRMDVSVNFHKEKRFGRRTWNLSVYNLYNRKNPYMVYEGWQNGSPRLMQLSIFPLLPSVSYIFKF